MWSTLWFSLLWYKLSSAFLSLQSIRRPISLRISILVLYIPLTIRIHGIFYMTTFIIASSDWTLRSIFLSLHCSTSCFSNGQDQVTSSKTSAFCPSLREDWDIRARRNNWWYSEHVHWSSNSGPPVFTSSSSNGQRCWCLHWFTLLMAERKVMWDGW